VIAYYANNAGWDAAWSSRSLANEVVALRHSPLFKLVRSLMPPPLTSTLVLDAGCGLGAWVALLIEQGYRVVGVDATTPPPSSLPVYQGQVENLWMVGKENVGVYLSLGVIEHEAQGPDRILREAARVLKPGGLALVSVPYVNGLRRVLSPWIKARQRIKSHPLGQGAQFYQYAFTQHELTAALVKQGLRVVSTHPYGPTKMFRTWFSEKSRDAYDAGATWRMVSPTYFRRAIRWFLYTRPMLRLCGHMLLAVAVKK